MNSRVLFGSYVPMNAPLHRLDPRLKLVTCFWYVVLVFFARGPWTYLMLVAMLAGMIGLSKIALRLYWTGIKPLIWVIGLTVAIQILFSSGGHVYWHWGLMAITSAGIAQAFVILARFILIVLASTVLTATTPPLRLADAIESLMRPLKKLRVPVNQIAMMISIALRFIPTIMEEVSTIVKAQQARGVDFASGSLYTRVKRMVPIMVPLFIGAFRRAEDLAMAMEARGYDPDQERTRYRQLTWQRPDSIVLAVVVLVSALFFLVLAFT
ncbi:MAG: energy-coupling factor transporter transmembrane component T [Limosilactobacillus gorillae]|uniref:energy-coupling factor transporter transmembrane component T family protein n=1 Tax=Limosilactobacillus gorillae TaxID=1450649 RepID=UPI000B887ACF|nr:energy-coupling factor transporter transmembrane component T [Limosilactobacillus gorillae]MDO4855645.1 energy-coupling factor transporter transmembrane component T [Limosilactobacillus gorillae]